ncbi:hypothetical protein A9Q84_01870 [Halobacteriovorax marinus]|uniref:TonB-dependent receptor n=1 Tax=Halobacteriovorax marinus TaxID=97084 RepID=A0A1Y5FCQ0_9BACT|nr:hypothetical protein A9Q84_01870 [Halobacteriovorax marinus]
MSFSISFKESLFLILPLLFCSSAFAQEVNQLESIYIVDEFGVTSVEGDSVVEEIDEESLTQVQASSIDDILRLTPGATTTGGPRSSGEEIQIRGLGSKKLFMYIDGVKQNFSTDHSSMLALDPDNLKSVEIYKSTSAFSKGGSIGGGVVFTTKDASDYLAPGEKFGSTLKSAYTNSNREQLFSLKTYTRFDDSDLLFTVTKRNAQDAILGDRTTLENSSYDDMNFFTKFTTKTNSHDQLKVSFEQFRRNDTVPMNPTLNPPVSIGDLNGVNEITRRTYNLEYATNPKNNRYLNLHSTFYSTTQTLDKVRASDKQHDFRKIETSGGSLKNRVSINRMHGKDLSLDTGLELVQDTLSGERDGGELASYPGGKSSEQSAFTQVNIPVSKSIDIFPALRYQNYDLVSNNPSHAPKQATELSKKLGTSYKPFKFLAFTGTYSEGFNAPKIQDVYVDGLHHKGDGFFISDNFFTPNPELEHETSKMLEVGAKFEKNIFSKYDLLTLKANYYWNEAKNYIYFEKIEGDPFEGTNGTTKFVNIPEVSLKGREFGMDYLYDRVEFGLSYSRNRGTNKTLGLYLADMPADQYNYNFKYHLDEYGLVLGYLGINTLKQDRINRDTTERTDETPGYFIHNIFVTKSFIRGALKGFSVMTRVDNFTNRNYRKHGSNINEIGLDVKVGLSYKINHF